MNNEDEVIEILDDFENNTIIIPPININEDTGKDIVTNSGSETPTQQNLVNFGVSSSNEMKPKKEMGQETKKIEEAKYRPIEPEKVSTNIDIESKDEESKSGLGFVIVLFILLAAFIIALPYISKLF